MAKRRAPHHEPPPEEPSEGFVRGTVKRLFETGVAAPQLARSYLLEQIAGWKQDFLGIFQAEIRRFFDRLEPNTEVAKLLEGKKIEVKLAFRLVDDEDSPSPRRRK